MNLIPALFCLCSLAFVFVNEVNSFPRNAENGTAENHRVMRKRSTSEMEGGNNPGGMGFVPDLCQDPSLDAATRTKNGNTYVFKDEYYWKVLNNAIAECYPRKIVDDWEGLPAYIDAALTLSNGKTFFFKGASYWRFTNRQMDCGYPKFISVGFPGIPNYVDAAFVWSGTGIPYFLKGQEYWAYDVTPDPQPTQPPTILNYLLSSYYPRQITKWSGLPNDINAAVQWVNDKTYFFKGDKYYLFDDGLNKVDTETYPLLTASAWFGCSSNN